MSSSSVDFSSLQFKDEFELCIMVGNRNARPENTIAEAKDDKEEEGPKLNDQHFFFFWGPWRRKIATNQERKKTKMSPLCLLH